MQVGCLSLAVADAVQGVTLPVHVLYPTDAVAKAERFGPYELEVARDAPVTGSALPLVAISHGNGGTPWGYRWLVPHLARAGFAVVLVEHLGNSRTDNSLADSPQNLANRPRHVKLALSAALDALAPHAIDRAAVVGHSFGGYTALAIAGGAPMAMPDQTPDGVACPVEVEHDPRVRACVLLAPALPWFLAPGALAGVRVPLFVRTAARDDLVPPFFVEKILAGLPAGARMDYACVPDAGHFAFWGPVPPLLASPSFLPGQDPPGFDRAAYQAHLRDEIVTFLHATLT